MDLSKLALMPELIPAVGTALRLGKIIDLFLEDSKEESEKKEFSVQEASTLLGISEKTIKRRIKDGKIEAYINQAGKYMIPNAEISKYVTASSRTKSGLENPLKGLEKILNNPAQLRAFIRVAEPQLEVYALEIQKLELQKERDAKNTNNKENLNQLEEQILDIKLARAKLNQKIETCKAFLTILNTTEK